MTMAMNLPVLEAPQYDMTIPSTKQKVKYRPWRIGEEKLLLMAMESQSLSEIVDATKQIISNCTFGKVDPEKLASFDIEYIFLELRKRARGNMATLVIRCPKQKEDAEGELVYDDEAPVLCGKRLEIQYDLNDLALDLSSVPTSLIKVNDAVSVKMRYPNFDILKSILPSDDGQGEETVAQELKATFSMIASCIESIVEGENVHLAEDQTQEALQEWLLQLDDEQFSRFTAFFDGIPKIKGTLKYQCPCGKYTVDDKVEGLRSFFS